MCIRDRYSVEIDDYIRDAIGSEFLTETFDNNEGNLTGYKNDIVWTFIELYAMELIDNIDNEEFESNEDVDTFLKDHLEIVTV